MSKLLTELAEGLIPFLWKCPRCEKVHSAAPQHNPVLCACTDAGVICTHIDHLSWFMGTVDSAIEGVNLDGAKIAFDTKNPPIVPGYVAVFEDGRVALVPSVHLGASLSKSE